MQRFVIADTACGPIDPPSCASSEEVKLTVASACRLTSLSQAVAGLYAIASKLAIPTVVLLSSAVLPLSAQVSGGTISGAITDPRGASLPNVRVVLTNIATNEARTITTNAEGLYIVPNLLPGMYQVSAEAPGFSGQIIQHVNVTVGSQREIDMTMQLKGVQQNIQVRTEDAANVETNTSEVSGTVNSETMRALPLNARDWTQLATLEPGVDLIHTQPAINSGANRGNRGYGAQLTISGQRPTQNSYRLNGININDYTNGAPGSVLGVNLGVDAVQEFSVVTSSYPAEYGRTSGGVINGVSRSGTNRFHGDAYEFARNSALDARNFFDGATKPDFSRNQFGAAAGGPIRKDHTFVFGDYEGVRQSLGITNIDTVPSQAARSGSLSNGQVSVDPAVQPYLAFFPLPNAGILPGGDTGLYSFVGKQVVDENFITARADHRIGKNDALFGTFLSDDAKDTQPDALGNTQRFDSTARKMVSIEESHSFGSDFLNAFRVGFSRVAAVVNSSAVLNPLGKDLNLGFIPGRPAGEIVVPGLTLFQGGPGGSPNYKFHWNSFQVYDDAFLTRGRHSVKFGFALERMQDNILAAQDPSGLFTFGSLSSFLTNAPQRFDAAISGGISPRDLRQTLFGGYVQDDVRFSDRFTLNAGLRYEITTVPTERGGKLSTLRHITDPQPHLGSPYFQNPTLRNFEPRLGFAWDPSGKGKTAIRAGAGMFDVLPLPYEFEIISSLNAPFFELGSTSSLPQGSFPSNAFPLIATNPLALRQSYVEPKPARSYVVQWNANVQRQIGSTLTGMVAYVGSRGIHLPFRADDINMVLPIANTPLGYLWPTPAGSFQTVNPNVGQVNGLMWRGDSYYHALQLHLTRQPTQGFQIEGSYTFGKSIDTGSATLAGDQFDNSISSLLYFDSRVRRSLSDFDIRQNLVINSLWEIPGPRSAKGFKSLALQGWNLGGIFQASSGTPFTLILGGDVLGLNSSDPYDFPNRFRGAGCGTAVSPGSVQYVKTQCFTFPTPATLLGNSRRNSLIGPGLSTLDMSLIKNNYFGAEKAITLQLRLEGFNVLNHTNFYPPIDNEFIFDQTGQLIPGAGQVDKTATTSRQVQAAVKLIW
jgi:hypothetical protein